jgi:hypothetical protein
MAPLIQPGDELRHHAPRRNADRIESAFRRVPELDGIAVAHPHCT